MSDDRGIRNGVWIVTFGFLLQQMLAFVTSVAVARSIGAAEFGAISILRNILAFLLTLTPLGLDLALLKHAAFFDERPTAFEHEVARLRILIAVVNAGIVFLAYIAGGAWLQSHVYHFRDFSRLLFIALLGLPFAADLSLLGAVYRASHRQSAYALMTNYTQPFVRLGAALLLLYLGWSALGVILAYTGAYIVSSLLVVSDMNSRTAEVPSGQKFDIRDWSGTAFILRDSLWMAISLFVGGAMRSVDMLTLGIFVSAREVGSYAALSTVAQLVQAYPFAASQTLGPTVSRFHRDGDRRSMKRAMSDYLRSASIAGGFLFGGIAAFGDHLDLLFGRSFHFRPDIAFMLPLGWLLSATLGPMGYTLSMTGRHRLELGILLTGLATLILGCVVLAPRWGQMGAAVAVVVAFAFINLVRFSYTIRIFGFVPGTFRDLLPPLFAFGLAMAVKLNIDQLLGRSLASFVLSCALYAVLDALMVFYFFLDFPHRETLRRRALIALRLT